MYNRMLKLLKIINTCCLEFLENEMKDPPRRSERWLSEQRLVISKVIKNHDIKNKNKEIMMPHPYRAFFLQL